MLLMTDLKTDNADDIILLDDILIDETAYDSPMKTIERRLTSRGEDFVIDTNISAALEKYLFGSKDSYTREDILNSINNAVLANGLLSPQDFTLLVEQTNDSRYHIFIKFTNPLIDQGNAFRIIVDVQNQRVYRGY